MVRVGLAQARITVEKLERESQRADALKVVDEVYVREKGWLDRSQLDEFPHGSSVTWLLARVDGEPVGLMRLLYDPPLDFPQEYDVTLHDTSVDWWALAQKARIVEVGRLMIRDAYRRQIAIVVKLMNRSICEVVDRNYTHLLTDVFEGDPHSPYNFHTRVLGFQEIGSHTIGEMRTSRKRIILVLDVDEAYRKMKQRGSRFFRELTDGCRDQLEQRIGGLREAEG